MDKTAHFGLPKLVVDLLSSQAEEKGVEMRWKIFNSGQFTELKLTWCPKQPEHRAMNRTHVHKTPSAMRRDHVRKQQYRTKRINTQQVAHNHGNLNMSSKTCDRTTLTHASIQCNIVESGKQGNGCANQSHKEERKVPVRTIHTRSMADPTEKPRHSDMSQDVCVMSPESVMECPDEDMNDSTCIDHADISHVMDESDVSSSSNSMEVLPSNTETNIVNTESELPKTLTALLHT